MNDLAEAHRLARAILDTHSRAIEAKCGEIQDSFSSGETAKYGEQFATYIKELENLALALEAKLALVGVEFMMASYEIEEERRLAEEESERKHPPEYKIEFVRVADGSTFGGHGVWLGDRCGKSAHHLTHEVAVSASGCTELRQLRLPDANALYGMLDKEYAIATAATGETKNKGGRPRGRIEDHVALLDEFNEGKLWDKWKTQKEFADHKDIRESTMSERLKVARAKRKQDPEFGKRSENLPP